MNLLALKSALKNLNTLRFKLPNGEFIPEHFHITEVGKITKHFIDCGGTVRTEHGVNIQLWYADDYDHRLAPEKLLQIIDLSERELHLSDADIEVEYQGYTIQKFGLAFKDEYFLLTPKQTDCLAKDKCGIPEEKTAVPELSSNNDTTCCSPDGSCC